MESIDIIIARQTVLVKNSHNLRPFHEILGNGPKIIVGDVLLTEDSEQCNVADNKNVLIGMMKQKILKHKDGVKCQKTYGIE